MSKLTPCLWFNFNADEAIQFYSGIFSDLKIIEESRMPDGGPTQAGALMTATFEIAGQRIMALNGGPQFPFTEAISLFISCEDQAEVDHYYDSLVAGGTPSQCGWLKDKFGLSWQIVPTALGKYLGDSNPAKAESVMKAMLQMSKLDVDTLTKAYEAG